MGVFDIPTEDKKFKKRITLSDNVLRGKLAEDNVKVNMMMNGYDVERTGRGSDFRVRKNNSLLTGRKGPWRLIEVKSSKTAPVSKLQKKILRKKKGKVKRVDPFSVGFGW